MTDICFTPNELRLFLIIDKAGNKMINRTKLMAKVSDLRAIKFDQITESLVDKELIKVTELPVSHSGRHYTAKHYFVNKKTINQDMY